jgi:flavin reductase (DIM6/NTAB) family NADH-FMN oxidoreductase RutF
MQIDPTTHSHADVYKLLTNVVVPRPIAWITTLGPDGVVNLAPFSFFNAISGHPPCVVAGIGRRESGGSKDTLANIVGSGEFVVNMVTEELLAAMNLSAADFAPGESELQAAGLHAAPSTVVRPPRVAESRASLECRLVQSQSLGTSTVIFGEVVMFHVDDALMGPRMHVQGFAPIGRLGSPSAYCRTTDRIELPRVSRRAP